MKRKVPEVSDEEELKIWRCNEKVTLVDNDNDGFAHGVVVAASPTQVSGTTAARTFRRTLQAFGS